MNRYFPNWMGATPRANTSWPTAEDMKFKEEWYKSNLTIQEIAEIHGREENAILCRAEKLFNTHRDLLVPQRNRRIMNEAALRGIHGEPQHEAKTVTTSEYLKARCDELERRIANIESGGDKIKARLDVLSAGYRELSTFKLEAKAAISQFSRLVEKFRGI